MKLSAKLYNRAMDNYQSGDLDAALEDIEQGIQLLRKTAILLRKRQGPDFKRYIDAKILQGRIYSTMGLLEEASEVIKYLKTLNMGTDDEGMYLQGKVNYFLYELEMDQDNEEEALTYLDKAKYYFYESGEYEHVIEILFDLEESEKYRQDESALMDLYKEILDINKKLSDKSAKRTNSGRARLRIARVLSRSNIKKSRKSLIKAYNDLIDTPYLQIESMFSLANMYIYEAPEKARELLDKILELSNSVETKFQVLLYQFMLNIITGEDENETVKDELKGLVNEIKVNTPIAERILDLGRVGVIYNTTQTETISELLKSAIESFDNQNDKAGKVIGYLIESLLTKDLNERENRVKLVDVYSKSLKNDGIILRSSSLDMINWINSDETEITSAVKEYYSGDRIKQAESLKLLGMYLKNSDMSKNLLQEAKSIFRKTKLIHQHVILSHIDEEIAQLM